MADNDFFTHDPHAQGPQAPGSQAQGPAGQASPPARRAGPDPLTLTAGLLTLAVAVYVLFGGSWSPQWVLAIGAIGIGGAMLVVSLRPRRDR